MKVENPALLARAVPGKRSDIGMAYLKAAAWLGPGWLSERLHDIGAVLRDTRNFKKPADAVWACVRIHDGQRKLNRPETARRYREVAHLIGEGESLPAELAAWLAPRLAAMADAIGNMDDTKPANAVYRACGAGRAGSVGNLAGDADQDARDAALVWEVEYQRRMHPELKHAGLFDHVAGLWSHGRTQLSAPVVEAAWKRRRIFLQ